jgi:predicted Zn-dependent protease
VFARDDINAFALTGSRIGVFEGMFRVADTPVKLAAVLGHEHGASRAGHRL